VDFDWDAGDTLFRNAADDLSWRERVLLCTREKVDLEILAWAIRLVTEVHRAGEGAVAGHAMDGRLDPHAGALSAGVNGHCNEQRREQELSSVKHLQLSGITGKDTFRGRRFEQTPPSGVRESVRLRTRIFVLAVGFCAAAAVAAEPEPLGPGLDLLVIVDRSESMADRKIAALLLHMALDIVSRNGQALRLRHRVGVIGFGSTVSIDVPLALVDSEHLPRLHSRIDSLPSNALGDTDVLAAFRAAAALFESRSAEAARRRAVVLLTDGVPYVRGANMADYRRELQRFAAARFRGGDPTVDVLLLAPTSGQRYTELWRALAFDRVRAVDGAHAPLLAEAHRILTRLVGTSSSESLPSKTDDRVDLLVVPPYLDVVVLDIFHSSPAAKVEVFPPGALRPLKAGSDGVENLGLGNVLSTLVVHRPVPGTWTVRKSSADARVRILSQQFFPKGMLVRPAVTDGVLQYDRVRVAYSVVDANGKSLEEHPDYRLALDLSLTRPDGTVEVLPMERRPALAGTVFEAVRDSDCAFAGRYWTTVGVTSIDADGNRIDVFRDRWSGFSAKPATPVDCRVTAEEERWIPGLGVRVECVGGNKRPIEMSAFASGSPARLFQPLVLHKNAKADAALDLQYIGGGIFHGLLRGAEGSGTYRLRLAVDRARLRPPYNVRFVAGDFAFARRSTVLWRWLGLLSAVITVIGVARWHQHRSRIRVPDRKSTVS
jgi:Mg-chelatase subunit ChlD